VAAETGAKFLSEITFASNAARTATLAADGTLVFDKGQLISRGPQYCPWTRGSRVSPDFRATGSGGDADYSPFVQVTNAGADIQRADRGILVSTPARSVSPMGTWTTRGSRSRGHRSDQPDRDHKSDHGFSFGRPVWYISMDTSIPLGAAIEHNTFAPLMQKLNSEAMTASPVRSSGFHWDKRGEGCNNPQRQGLSADLNDGARPNNVLGESRQSRSDLQSGLGRAVV